MARPRSLKKRLGFRIRTRRDALGWTQAKLAEVADVSVNYVSILERGQQLPALDTLLALAKALGVSASDLLDDARAPDVWLDDMVTVAVTVPKARRELALALLKTVATTAG